MMGLSRRQTIVLAVIVVLAALTAGPESLAFIVGRVTMAAAVTLVAMRAYNGRSRGATTA